MVLKLIGLVESMKDVYRQVFHLVDLVALMIHLDAIQCWVLKLDDSRLGESQVVQVN
jgi:hypothetical protein